MKSDIHPKYHEKAQINCACGNSWTTGSTLQKIDLEICSKCHPFYTGKEKRVDTRGRIEKFTKRAQKHAEAKKNTTSKKPRVKKNAKDTKKK